MSKLPSPPVFISELLKQLQLGYFQASANDSLAQFESNDKKVMASFLAYLDEYVAAVINNIDDSIRQHTVQEGPGLASKSYIRNTLEFERQRHNLMMKGQSNE